MILIDLDKPVQDLVLTLTELTTVETPVYLLLLHNTYSGVSTKLLLQSNLSNNLNRYDHYQISTSDLMGLEVGNYSYTVFQSSVVNYDETQLGAAIETGLAKVIAPVIITAPITFKPDANSGTYIFNKPND